MLLETSIWGRKHHKEFRTTERNSVMRICSELLRLTMICSAVMSITGSSLRIGKPFGSPSTP